MTRLKIQRKSAKTKTIVASKKMRDLLDEIATVQNLIKTYTAQVAKDSEQLMTYMQEAGLLEIITKNAKGVIEIPMGRTTRVVRPLDVKRLVPEKDFLAAVSISITAAKKILSEKELEKVVTVTAPRAKDPILKVTMR